MFRNIESYIEENKQLRAENNELRKMLRVRREDEVKANAERIYQCVNGWDELKQQRDDLLEACEIINRGQLSEMKTYCIEHKIHEGIGDFSSALLMSRIAEQTLKGNNNGI